MAKRKTPLDFLLAAIESKRRLSLAELGKTDLYGGAATVDDVTAWYDRLSTLARENPPQERVATLRIMEDERGNISGVEYVYRGKAPTPPTKQETTFVIETKFF
jgi:hypothetical protein